MALPSSGAMQMGGNVNVELGSAATTQISLGQATVRTLYGIASGAIRLANDGYGKSNIVYTQKAAFAYGYNPGAVNSIRYISSSGVIGAITPGTGTARSAGTGATYGNDKGFFAYGNNPGGSNYNIYNLMSNTGVVAADSPGVGTARSDSGGAKYGLDKGIIAYGRTSYSGWTTYSLSNLVSNTGVVASDTPGVGTARYNLSAAGYGNDKAFFAYGHYQYPAQSTTAPVKPKIHNLVSNTGVVASDTPNLGTGRSYTGAAAYGNDKAIIGFGNNSPAWTPQSFVNTTNLVSNTGVVASDTPGIGTARVCYAAVNYGGDKAIFGGGGQSPYNVTNLVSNTGVVASNVTSPDTVATYMAAGYSATA